METSRGKQESGVIHTMTHNYLNSTHAYSLSIIKAKYAKPTRIPTAENVRMWVSQLYVSTFNLVTKYVDARARRMVRGNQD